MSGFEEFNINNKVIPSNSWDSTNVSNYIVYNYNIKFQVPIIQQTTNHLSSNKVASLFH